MKGPGNIEEQPVPATLQSDLPSLPSQNGEVNQLQSERPGFIAEQPVPATLYPNLPSKSEIP